jgi:hypothetical protein
MQRHLESEQHIHMEAMTEMKAKVKRATEVEEDINKRRVQLAVKLGHRSSLRNAFRKMITVRTDRCSYWFPPLSVYVTSPPGFSSCSTLEV